MKTEIVVALAGNPNSGKTTIFNALTGARQRVGNYPGVTVERKEGRCRHRGVEITIVDLPGTYSLNAHSEEEIVARDFIVKERPDVVVDIVDASNLERNLYLAVQLMELGAPLVLAFNMSDVAEAKGYDFDLKALSRLLGVRIVPTVGNRGKGLHELMNAVLETAAREFNNKHAVDEGRDCALGSRTVIRGARTVKPRIDYGKEVEEEIERIEAILPVGDASLARYNPRWLAIKLLERDRELRKLVPGPILGEVERGASRIEEARGETVETAIASARYGFISGVCRKCVRSTIEVRRSMSDRIDSVVTHRFLGIPIFLGLMYLVFHLVFTLGDPPMGWIEGFFSWLGQEVEGVWPQGKALVLKSLVVDGLIGGVGGVVVFLPNIMLLFLAIAFLEDTGYMARAAFIMDRVMHKTGLHGKSFIPMLIGFGCSVPAIMATRTLENKRDRLATMLVTPLMSCGARLPIYALIIPAFFPKAWHGPMLWTIYMIGILLAVIGAKVLRSTVLKGDPVPFVMELPPYRMPTAKGLFIHMWERGRLYLKKAGTIILGISMILWAMTSFPGPPQGKQDEALRYTIAGRVGQAMEPLLRPMGFDWKIGTALIGAFAAKEVFVAQMGIVYSVEGADEGSESLRQRLRQDYSPLVGFCIMLFCLISAPCMATIAVTKKESGSWRWALFQLGGLTAVAYVVTVAVFQLGSLLQIGTS